MDTLNSSTKLGTVAHADTLLNGNDNFNPAFHAWRSLKYWQLEQCKGIIASCTSRWWIKIFFLKWAWTVKKDKNKQLHAHKSMNNDKIKNNSWKHLQISFYLRQPTLINTRTHTHTHTQRESWLCHWTRKLSILSSPPPLPHTLNTHTYNSGHTWADPTSYGRRQWMKRDWKS